MKNCAIALLFLSFLFITSAFSQTFDASYDGRDYGYVSDVRDQASLGACWAFSATSMMEASLLKQRIVTDTSYHFSTYDTAYWGNVYAGYTTSMTDYNSWSGNANNAYNLGRYEGGLVSESTTPYPASIVNWQTNVPLTPPAENALGSGYMTHDIYRVNVFSPTSSEQYKDIIKGYVKNNGGAEIGYSVYSPTPGNAMEYFADNNTSFRNATTDNSASHTGLIVGWDDNKTITVGGVTSTGAWLVKNSWGTSFGDNGYFWMAYDSMINGLSSAVARGGYGEVYSHRQELELNGGLVGLSSVYALQNYTTAGEEFLQAVSLSYTIYDVSGWTSTNLASYELKIYSTKTGNNLSDLLYGESGDIHDGMTTIDLKQLVQINGNFYILIKVTRQGSDIGGFNMYVGGDAGNGWCSWDGVTYYDMATEYSDAYTWDIDALMAIPEPSTYALLFGGFICLGLITVRKRRNLSPLW